MIRCGLYHLHDHSSLACSQSWRSVTATQHRIMPPLPLPDMAPPRRHVVPYVALDSAGVHVRKKLLRPTADGHEVRPISTSFKGHNLLGVKRLEPFITYSKTTIAMAPSGRGLTLYHKLRRMPTVLIYRRNEIGSATDLAGGYRSCKQMHWGASGEPMLPVERHSRMSSAFDIC